MRYILALAVSIPAWEAAKADIKNVPQDYPFIQLAIDSASHGDTILVAPDTYHENINFRGKAIMVTSEFILDHDESKIATTIIDGHAYQDEDSASVVSFVSGEGRASVLTGLTLTGGYGTVKDDVGRAFRRGGGIICFFSSPTISHNIITNNDLDDDTRAVQEGAGIACLGSGGALIINNLISFNNCSGPGGAIFISAYPGGLEICNNVIHGNSNGISVSDLSKNNLAIYNNIIYENIGYGLDISELGGRDVAFNAFWSNSPDIISSFPWIGDTVWGYNLNGIPCDSFYNIIADPMFASTGIDYHLVSNSPCINAGNMDIASIPDYDFGGESRLICGYLDMGIYEFPIGMGKCGDANNDGNVNVSDVVRIISYLFTGGAPPDPVMACGDANGDGAINVSDAVRIINYVFIEGLPPDDCGFGSTSWNDEECCQFY